MEPGRETKSFTRYRRASLAPLSILLEFNHRLARWLETAQGDSHERFIPFSLSVIPFSTLHLPSSQVAAMELFNRLAPPGGTASLRRREPALFFALTTRQPCGACGKSARYRQRLKRPIWFRLEAADGSVAIVQAVEKTSVAALSHIGGVAASAGQAGLTIRGDRRKAAVGGDFKARNRAAAGIGRISKTSVVGQKRPAGGGLVCGHRAADHGQIIVVRQFVGRDGAGIGRPACCFGDKEPVFAANVEAKGLDSSGRKGLAVSGQAIFIHLKNVNQARRLFGHDESIAVSREGNLPWFGKGGTQRAG